MMLISNIVLANDNHDYSELTKQAWEHYQKQQYLQSGEFYTQALSLLKPDQKITNKEKNDFFNAACAYALANEKHKAFDNLFQLANRAKFSNLKQLNNDGDLKSLHAESKWKELIKVVEANYELIKPLDESQLEALYKQYVQAQKQVFTQGSTDADVDHLYSFYTNDFVYNHPGYGDEYSREHLYNNTLRNLKAGRYNNSKKRTTINKILGLNAIVIEQQYEGETETTMTLFKFRKDKIYYIHEYW